MSDTLKNAINTVIVNDMAMKFTKVHSPKMKSVYWKHFGFPTNENDHIITKQSVVCILCKKVLTNHGNTTNLRAHLQHRHKEIFHKICRENDIKIPQRKPQQSKQTKDEFISDKIKLEFQNFRQSNEDANNPDDHSMLYESMVPITYEDDGESYSKTDLASVCSQIAPSPSLKAESTESMDLMDEECEEADVKSSSYHLDVIEMDSYQIQDALVNLIVKDLRNIESLYDHGMYQFLRNFSGCSQIPPEKKIESIIQEQHSDKLTTLADQLKVHSQVKNYSLGFELWANVESKYFISIYYNYNTELPELNFQNILYCTIEYNKYTSIDSIFNEFNIENCSAALVNYDDDDYLKEFLRSKRIPVILSYSTIIDKCLQGIFAIPTVNVIIEEVKEVITRYTSEIHSKDVEIPMIYAEFPWTYYELLKFFSETVSWPEDVDSLVCSSKIITDTIAPLAVILDTLKREDIPHSSMVTPISTKILKKKFVIMESDDDFVTKIKSAILSNLHKYVLSDSYLTISALLDPRFHRLIDIDNVMKYVLILNEQSMKMSQLQGLCTKGDTIEKSCKKTCAKSNLELFFDIQDNTACSSALNNTNIEIDLKRYRNEVYVSLDESPSMWWTKVGHLYSTLKQLALSYQCVPCVVNMDFKKPLKQQITEHLKRFMLTGGLIDAILFLHYHTK